MLIIAHRGNLEGPEASQENSPKQIEKAIEKGFETEIDVWLIDDKWYLGHDSPTYEINEEFFTTQMWLHCKNIEAVEHLEKTELNWFWHSDDKMTLTSKGNIWTYSGVYIKNGVVVECGKPFEIKEDILGVCTDYPFEWRNFRS